MVLHSLKFIGIMSLLKPCFAWIIASLIVVSLFNQSEQTRAHGQKQNKSQARLDNIIAEIDEYVQAILKCHDIPGIALAVVYQGEVNIIFFYYLYLFRSLHAKSKCLHAKAVMLLWYWTKSNTLAVQILNGLFQPNNLKFDLIILILCRNTNFLYKYGAVIQKISLLVFLVGQNPKCLRRVLLPPPSPVLANIHSILAYDVPDTEDVDLPTKFRFNVGPAHCWFNSGQSSTTLTMLTQH